MEKASHFFQPLAGQWVDHSWADRACIDRFCQVPNSQYTSPGWTLGSLEERAPLCMDMQTFGIHPAWGNFGQTMKNTLELRTFELMQQLFPEQWFAQKDGGAVAKSQQWTGGSADHPWYSGGSNAIQVKQSVIWVPHFAAPPQTHPLLRVGAAWS